ncbi:YgjV family protein [Vibrio sp. 404]|uniref:YgjV family protein n=1 Tax=Vibrio marinisediminis TaxID=2758441 RepID=A0A7W2FRA8_9VIBR|nr:YgjV family protein [Vibrio marinisediminis]MBA5762839.1 YgjV family protein [Vibrio marinisediminis]
MPEWNLAQAIGMVAFVIGATAFLHSDGRRFRLHLMVFQVVLCSHFIMMGALVAAFGCGISAIRSYASTKTQSTPVMLFFIAMLWVMGVPQLEHSYELLTIFGSSVATWALFKTQGIQMRLLVMFNSFCWVTNNLLLGSIGGTLMELTFIIVNSLTILRMYRTGLRTPA